MSRKSYRVHLAKEEVPASGGLSATEKTRVQLQTEMMVRQMSCRHENITEITTEMLSRAIGGLCDDCGKYWTY